MDRGIVGQMTFMDFSQWPGAIQRLLSCCIVLDIHGLKFQSTISLLTKQQIRNSIKKDNPIDLLKENIAVLAFKQEEDLTILKRQFELTYDSLRPANLIKSAIIDMASVSGLKSTLVSNAIGLTTGYLSKKKQSWAAPIILSKKFQAMYCSSS